MDEDALIDLRASHHVIYDPELINDRKRLLALLSGAAALIVRNRTIVDEALLKAAPQLSCVGRLGVGLDNFDLTACENRNIAVYPATGANDASVAEYVLTAALNLLRGAYFSRAAMIAGQWPRQNLMGSEIAGKTLGLIGFGSIARETATRARALGMTISAHDPYLPRGDPAWEMVQRLDLADLLKMADVVSLHVPLTPETRHLIDAKALGSMKNTAILINAARGGVVEENALVSALRQGQIGGAALDVYENEPLDAEAGSRFIGIANLILTPHIAGVTVESNVRVSALTARQVLHHLE